MEVNEARRISVSTVGQLRAALEGLPEDAYFEYIQDSYDDRAVGMQLYMVITIPQSA